MRLSGMEIFIGNLEEFEKIMLDRTALRENPAYWENRSGEGIVAAAHYRATEIGAKILAAGGNAIDAAIAVSLALGLVEPAGSGLGGMMMMIVYLAREARTIVLAGPCRAPMAAKPELIDTSSRRRGYKAIAVPTNAAVLGYLHSNFSQLPLDQILTPVSQLAFEGVQITPFQSELRKHYRAKILKGNAAQFYLAEGNLIPAPGFIMQQPVPGKTLRRLAYAGFEDFYLGEIADKILQDMRKNNGFISKADFNPIPWPCELEPIWGDFHSWKIATLPPPGGGFTLIEMFNLFEALEPGDFDPDSPHAAVLFATIIQKCRLDRRNYYRSMLCDVPSENAPDLSGKSYSKLAAEELQEKLRQGETTHFNVIDKAGNCVAVTQSIERSFGAGVATPELGFLYNGFMKAFNLKNEKHPHYLRPGAIARSNASPTIVFENDKPRYLIGSTGSERMLSGIFQVLIRLYKKQSPFQTVKAPRLHCTPEGKVLLEAERFAPEVIRLLKKNGFEVIPYDSPWAFSAGGLQLAVYENGQAMGVADPRRDGWASGPDMIS